MKPNPLSNDKELSLEYQRRQEQRQLHLAKLEIDKRASRKEIERAQYKATYDINPFDSFFIRHAKSLTYCSLEMFHSTFFHFIETIKVRAMARNLTGDVSLYFKN